MFFLATIRINKWLAHGLFATIGFEGKLGANAAKFAEEQPQFIAKYLVVVNNSYLYQLVSFGYPYGFDCIIDNFQTLPTGINTHKSFYWAQKDLEMDRLPLNAISFAAGRARTGYKEQSLVFWRFLSKAADRASPLFPV